MRQFPATVRQALKTLVDQLAALQLQISALERGIQEQHRPSEASRRLEAISGIGVLVPRQHSTGSKVGVMDAIANIGEGGGLGEESPGDAATMARSRGGRLLARLAAAMSLKNQGTAEGNLS